jgi:hypothetical protein
VWINFAVDRFVFQEPDARWILENLPLMPVEPDNLSFGIDDVGKIQQLCLDFGAMPFNTDQFLHYLSEMIKLLRFESLGKVTVKARLCIARKESDRNLLAMDVEQNYVVFSMQSMQNAVLQEQEKAGWKLPFDIEISQVLFDSSDTWTWDRANKCETTRK